MQCHTCCCSASPVSSTQRPRCRSQVYNRNDKFVLPTCNEQADRRTGSQRCNKRHPTVLNYGCRRLSDHNHRTVCLFTSNNIYHFQVIKIAVSLLTLQHLCHHTNQKLLTDHRSSQHQNQILWAIRPLLRNASGKCDAPLSSTGGFCVAKTADYSLL